MRKSLTIVLTCGVALLSANNSAAREMNLQGVAFKVDTISHYLAGPATNYTRLLLSSENNKFNVSVLEIDRKATDAPQLKVAVAKESTRGVETVSALDKRKSNANERYFAGVNGDFFVTGDFATNLSNAYGAAATDDRRVFTAADVTGMTNNTCVTGGLFVAPNFVDVSSDEKALIICKDGSLYIDGTKISYTMSTVKDANGKMKEITRSDQAIVNFPRSNKDMTMYTKYYGATTGTDDTGNEITLVLADGETFGINRKMNMKVTAVNPGKGNSAIPENGFVISLGSKRTSQWGFVGKMQVGDPVEFTVNVKLSSNETAPAEIEEICGGDVRILKNENVTKKGDADAIRFINEATGKYIRTMVGYSKDRSKFVMATVDRECGGVGGVSYYDAADLMLALGCYDALDLDGGGSTEMWINTPGVVNYLRDKAERGVGNALFAVVTAPEDATINSVRFADHGVKLKKGDVYKPVYFGYNKNSELLNMNYTQGVKLSCTPTTAGTIGTDGSFTAATDDTYTLTATYNGQSHSIMVNGKEAAVSGIEEIATSSPAGEPEFYDINGIRVDELLHGNIYIRKDGNGRYTKVVY